MGVGMSRGWCGVGSEGDLEEVVGVREVCGEWGGGRWKWLVGME